MFFFFKQKTAYEMRISDWSSDVCSSDLVYAVAEMLRRFRGGAAVVMGALSPHTRNRQVAMFQAGEVDYLVATDAIGMGLNMDVAHVAFASLSQFDGRRVGRLTVARMAQLAGRAECGRSSSRKKVLQAVENWWGG